MSISELTKRIDRTSSLIDAIQRSKDHDFGLTRVVLTFNGNSLNVPEEFVPAVTQAVRAVLVQKRALDIVALAENAGIPTGVEGDDSITVVIQGPKALSAAPEEGSEDDS